MVDQTFRVIKDFVQPDGRGRISLGDKVKAKSYQMSVDDQGQILLQPLEGVLTLEEAAILLNVSKPYVEKLLRSGKIPYEQRDKQRFVSREDVLAYKKMRRLESEKIMAELVAQAQGLDLGY
jgi:excisionase family DNA binding protein